MKIRVAKQSFWTMALMILIPFNTLPLIIFIGVLFQAKEKAPESGSFWGLIVTVILSVVITLVAYIVYSYKNPEKIVITRSSILFISKRKKELYKPINISVQLKCYADFTCFLLFFAVFNAIMNGKTELKIFLQDGKTLTYDLPLWRVNGKRLKRMCKALTKTTNNFSN